ncbi:MAG: serine/threonine-protein kinase, partial [Polyangia bacterium]
MDELPPLFATGQRLGRYELLRRLAVGGMAEVYLAAAAGPGDFRKVVAIKRLLPQHALDPQLLRMFLDEARLMARLSHPHVPQVTDVDDGGGGEVPCNPYFPYFVMEYVHGTDLRGVLNAAGGPLPLEQALAITGAVAAGLHHAHEHRGTSGQAMDIVHRDVSPSNVLLSFDGGVKITDFGVAKWAEQKSHTHHGQLKGKFAHMSPEQCRGEALDRRSDVFALGTLLYEMTTGHPPFSADSEYDLLTQIVSRDAPAPRRPGEIYPAALETIVMKALRRDRNDRYASTQELQLDLESFARERRLVVSPVALAGYLESLFGAQVTEWREALASGKSLVDHLGRLSGLTPGAPMTEDGAAAARTTRTATDAFARARSPEAAA